jgi:homoserine O-acetyltransferase
MGCVDYKAREGVDDIPGGIALHHGGVLPVLRVAWRLAGPVGAPLVVVLGGISGHRRVYGRDGEAAGWWQEVAGPGGGFPSADLQVLSFDYLGGSGETSGPAAAAGGAGGSWFPSVSTYDQAEVLRRLLDHLGIVALDAIVGASYGGMVALAFAERHPRRVRRLLIVSAADRTDPMSTAWRSVQRQVIRFGESVGRGADGLRLARALAQATYRSREEFAARFPGEATRGAVDAPFLFPVESYLLARGADYAARYAPGGFLCLSESIDLHRVDAARITVPVDAVAVREDQLVPVADMRALVERLPVARLDEFSSHYGHDAFLKEGALLRPVFERLLEESR